MIKLYGGNEYLEVSWWNFPAGERGVRIEDPDKVLRYNNFMVELKYTSDQDIMDMLLLVNACRKISPNVHLWLKAEYMPYARQDRVTAKGTSFSLEVMADIINMCRFFSVEVVDPHSYVFSTLIDPKVLHVVPITQVIPKELEAIAKLHSTCILAPDMGAAGRAGAVGYKLGIPTYHAYKERDPATGKLSKVRLESDSIIGYNNIIVVDDICDGGYTFIQLAENIRAFGYKGKLALFVSHGIFSKGIDVVKEHYDAVLCYNDMRESK